MIGHNPVTCPMALKQISNNRETPEIVGSNDEWRTTADKAKAPDVGIGES